eukprot:m.490473 g.490473  ORF g.490473 m.490473 type:complete len:196 (+) comp21777_c0_seq3:282-869(+)
MECGKYSCLDSQFCKNESVGYQPLFELPGGADMLLCISVVSAFCSPGTTLYHSMQPYRPTPTTAAPAPAASAAGGSDPSTGPGDFDLSLFGPVTSDPVSRNASAGVDPLPSTTSLQPFDLDMFAGDGGTAVTARYAPASDSINSTSSALGLDFSDLYKQGPSMPKASLSEAAKAILDRMPDLSYMVPPKLSIPML